MPRKSLWTRLTASARYHGMRSTAKRWGRAWRYATGRMTTNDAWDLFLEVEDYTGYHSLKGIREENVTSAVIDHYGEILLPVLPELTKLVRQACRQAVITCRGNGETTGQAEDWACDIVVGYLAKRGIIPVPAET